MNTKKKVSIFKFLALYADAPIVSKFFLVLRVFFTPYHKIAHELPLKGKILDLGCGHGFFSVQLALTSPNRHVVGVDHDSLRIDLATLVAKNLSNLEFQQGSFFDHSDSNKQIDSSFEGVALIDVLHYFSYVDQLSILKNAYSLLKPGGTVVFREVNPNAGFVSKINHLWEKVATFTKFTKSKNEQNLTFRLPKDWEALLAEAGFSSVSSKSCSSPMFADVLFKGEKI